MVRLWELRVFFKVTTTLLHPEFDCGHMKDFINCG